MIFPTLILRVERWKFNKDYGVYVSTLGNFKDRHKRRLPIKVGFNGYCWVQTEASNSWVLAHRLVMFTWKPIPDAERLTVDHLNHNKRDNSLNNLEWVTREENVRRAKRDYIKLVNPEEEERRLSEEAQKLEDLRLARISEKARRKAERLASIAGYSIDGEGCYTKEETIERLVAMRGESSRKNTKQAMKNLENGTNQEGVKTFGKQTVRHIVRIIYKENM